MIGSVWAIGSITGVALVMGAATMSPPSVVPGEVTSAAVEVRGNAGELMSLPSSSAASTSNTFQIIHSDVHIPPNSECGYVAYYVEGANYEWYKNGKFAGSGEAVYFTSPSSGTVYLEVYAYVNGVQTNYADLMLYVDNQVSSCWTV